jgi:hypothetical protein
MSLYTNLRKYLEGPNRDPKEPYLTNAVVDFLNRIPFRDSKAFVHEVLLAPSAITNDSTAAASLRKLRRGLQSASGIIWRREDPVSYLDKSRPADVTARITGTAKPFLVIEAKIGAKHVDQLNYFGTTLAALHDHVAAPPAALIFLTHSTLPPEDFLNSGKEGAYGVPLRSVRNWIDFHEFLGRSWRDDFIRGLARELRSFLEELGMDTFNDNDFKVMDALFRGATQPKIAPFFEEARSALKPLLGNWQFGKSRAHDPFASSEGRGVWDWCYHGKWPGKPKGWYIAWGLCIPRKFYETDTLPEELVAFVDFSSDMPEFPISVDAIRRAKISLTDWQLFNAPEARCLKIKSVGSLAKVPGGFASAFFAWLKSTFKEADRLFAAAKTET